MQQGLVDYATGKVIVPHPLLLELLLEVLMSMKVEGGPVTLSLEKFLEKGMLFFIRSLQGLSEQL